MAVAITTILTEIENRLGNITTSNGYNTTVNRIEQAKLSLFRDIDLPAINFFPTSPQSSRNSYNKDDRTFSIAIYFYDMTRDDVFTTVANSLAADVVTALNRATTAPRVSDDPSNDLGGTVGDLIYTGYDYLTGEGQKPFCGALVKFDINYTTEPNNMSSYSA